MPTPSTRGTDRGVSTIAISERELQDAVADVARTLGWRVFHSRPARTSKGWRTPVQYDGKGYVDLTLVHEGRGRLIFAELKSDKGRTTPEQDAWLAGLERVAETVPDVVSVHVWTPADWPTAIVETLSHREVVAVS